MLYSAAHPPGEDRTDVTQILSAIARGEQRAAGDLLPAVYDELRRLAATKLAQERPGQTLQATALVHEAYVRVVGGNQSALWNSRGHFFAAAAEAMRRILVDSARRKASAKHGGQFDRIDLDQSQLAGPDKSLDLIALNHALDRLTTQAPRQAELVKLRFFAGLSIAQAADALGISESTADADWAYARAWLRLEIAD